MPSLVMATIVRGKRRRGFGCRRASGLFLGTIPRRGKMVFDFVRESQALDSLRLSF